MYFFSADDIKVEGGEGLHQGRVLVRRSVDSFWQDICDRTFGENEAAVICKQLNFRFVLYYTG